jgi:hypothetical protein
MLLCSNQLKYLVHVISKQRVTTDPAKVQAVQDWLVPTDVKQLRGFLGLSGYYRKLIRNYGSITKPLSDLLKKGASSLRIPYCNRVLILSNKHSPLLQYWHNQTSLKASNWKQMLVTRLLVLSSCKYATPLHTSVKP